MILLVNATYPYDKGVSMYTVYAITIGRRKTMEGEVIDFANGRFPFFVAVLQPITNPRQLDKLLTWLLTSDGEMLAFDRVKFLVTSIVPLPHDPANLEGLTEPFVLL
jgi:hypothetical protein